MIITAISPLGARPLDTKRTWETAGASRTRKFMSFRSTHSAAYNAEMGDEAESEDSSGSASQDADDAPSDAAEKGVGGFAVATRAVSRQVTTQAGVEDAYSSN
jgi:hypothetical protein